MKTLNKIKFENCKLIVNSGISYIENNNLKLLNRGEYDIISKEIEIDNENIDFIIKMNKNSKVNSNLFELYVYNGKIIKVEDNIIEEKVKEININIKNNLIIKENYQYVIIKLNKI